MDGVLVSGNPGLGAAGARGAGAREAGARTPWDLERLERIAWWLDDRFRIPGLGWRFGLDAVIGLVPWAGDLFTALMGLAIITSAVRHRVPPIVIARMALHVGFDFLVGLVPWIGDAGDFLLKSNRWNLELLRRHAGTGHPPRRSDYLVVGGVVLALLLVFAAGIALLAWVVGQGARFLPSFPS